MFYAKPWCVTCFTPLWNSSELVSRPNRSRVRSIWTLQWIHVIGSGMPTTEMAGWSSRFPAGVPSASGCELHSRRLWEANTNLLRLNLRPDVSLGSLVKGREGRTDVPANCQLQQDGPRVQTRRPSSRHAASRGMRCIGRLNAAGGARTGVESAVSLPLALVTLCNSPHAFTHNPYRGGDAPTRVLPSGPVADMETVCLAAASMSKLPEVKRQIDS